MCHTLLHNLLNQSDDNVERICTSCKWKVWMSMKLVMEKWEMQQGWRVMKWGQHWVCFLQHNTTWAFELHTSVTLTLTSINFIWRHLIFTYNVILSHTRIASIPSTIHYSGNLWKRAHNFYHLVQWQTIAITLVASSVVFVGIKYSQQ